MALIPDDDSAAQHERHLANLREAVALLPSGFRERVSVGLERDILSRGFLLWLSFVRFLGVPPGGTVESGGRVRVQRRAMLANTRELVGASPAELAGRILEKLERKEAEWMAGEEVPGDR